MLAFKSAMVMLAGVAAFSSSICGASAQSLKQQILGTWTLVSAINERDGKRSEPFGQNPIGLVIFTDDGYIVTMQFSRDRPKFASNNRATGTAEENKAVILGSLASFGTYTVNEAQKSFHYHFTASTFPNWDGLDDDRIVEVTGDKMRITNPSASVGGKTELVYTRAK